jgi:hypothetical protein
VGLFDKKKRANAAAEEVAVYYSTPYGDTKDGKPKLFMLTRGDGVPFYPVFRSRESCQDGFERMNRAAYLLIEGSLKSVAETLRSIEQLKHAGIVIEPFSEHPVEFLPNS